jgi:hypothetical protein
VYQCVGLGRLHATEPESVCLAACGACWVVHRVGKLWIHGRASKSGSWQGQDDWLQTSVKNPCVKLCRPEAEPLPQYFNLLYRPLGNSGTTCVLCPAGH